MKKLLLLSVLFGMLLIAGCFHDKGAPTPAPAPVPEPKPAPAPQPTPPPPAAKEPLKVGYVGPLTGDAAVYGIPLQRSYALAIKEVNAKGGVNGKQLELVSEDGKCTSSDAATAAQKLINVDNVKLIFGGVCSSETLGMAPIAEQADIVVLSPSSTSPEVTTAGDFIFRVAPSDALGGEKLAAYAAKNGWKRAGIINEQKDFPAAYAQAFKKSFTAKGGIVVTQETFTSEETDVSAQALKLKTFNPDVIFVVTQTPAKSAMVLKKIKSLNINKPILGGEVEILPDTIKEAGNAAEGVVGARAKFDEEDPSVQEFLSKYESEYNEKNEVGYYSVLARDSVYLVADAIKKGNYGGEALRDYLYSVNEWPGMIGPITIDQNGDSVLDYDILKVKDGKASKVE